MTKDRFDIRRVAHIFGGPFAGKTTLAKNVEAARPGLLIEFEEVLEHRYPEVSKEWRNPRHPKHHAWTRAVEAIRHEFDRHRLKGGITMSHDPTLALPARQQVWLFPGHDVLRARRRHWLQSAPLTKPQERVDSRISAADHWYAKAAQRDYANKFTQMDGARLERELLKLGSISDRTQGTDE